MKDGQQKQHVENVNFKYALYLSSLVKFFPPAKKNSNQITYSKEVGSTAISTAVQRNALSITKGCSVLTHTYSQTKDYSTRPSNSSRHTFRFLTEKALYECRVVLVTNKSYYSIYLLDTSCSVLMPTSGYHNQDQSNHSYLIHSLYNFITNRKVIL